MHDVRFIFLAVTAVLFAGAAYGAGEFIQMEPPKIWGEWKEAANQRGPNVTLVAWIPKEQIATSWKEGINFFSYLSRPPEKDAVMFLVKDAARQFAAACLGGSVVPPTIRSEDGIDTGYAQFYCPKRRDTGLGRLDFLKVITTEDRAFVVMAMKNTSTYQMSASGTLVFENAAEGLSATNWLKEMSEYLSAKVKVCRTVGASQVCSN